MKSRIFAVLLVGLGLAAGSPSYAQVFGQNLKVFVGYSNLQAEGLGSKNNNLPDVLNTQFFQDRTTLHGANAEVTAAIKGIGLTADASFNRKHEGADAPGGHNLSNTDLTYFMAGPSFAYAGHGRVEPFARVMAGVAHTRFEVGNSTDTSFGTVSTTLTDASTNLSLGVGGGLDLRMGEGPYRIRLIQVDYLPVFLGDKIVNAHDALGAIQQVSLQKQRLNNLRFSFGFVF